MFNRLFPVYDDPIRVPSLLTLSSFAVGALLANFAADEDDVYAYLPAHSRRTVLFEHLIRMLSNRVALPSAFPSLIDVCVDNFAYHQVAISD
jgi:hypothetical protein